MPKLPAITPRNLLKILEKHGFVVDHVTGSHYILYNSQNGKRVTVPFHRREIPKGTLNTILKEAGIVRSNLS